MAGFRASHRLSGGGGLPPVVPIKLRDAETITAGDILNLESGLADLGATGDTNLIGAAAETILARDVVAGVTEIRAYEVPDLVYSVDDANARKKGDTLDLRGATGAQGVTTSSNREFVVIADSSATQPTLVVVNRDVHWLTKAQ